MGTSNVCPLNGGARVSWLAPATTSPLQLEPITASYEETIYTPWRLQLSSIRIFDKRKRLQGAYDCKMSPEEVLKVQRRCAIYDLSPKRLQRNVYNELR
ncbi:hypothetical protein ACEPAI_4434 [Sanghuangporus weigelae]